MDASFWRERWERNEIAFHQSKTNPLLATYFGGLSLPKGDRVFVPLCGKTFDIHWLLSQSYRVAGIELSKIAIGQLFGELGVEPKIDVIGKLTRYTAPTIDIFVGDIFDLSKNDLGRIDTVYDRAALVALPEPMRNRYAAHLMDISDCAPQFLITYTYDQRLVEGPPFSVSNEEVADHYEGRYDLQLVASVEVAGGLKGKFAATENAWLLKRRCLSSTATDGVA